MRRKERYLQLKGRRRQEKGQRGGKEKDKGKVCERLNRAKGKGEEKEVKGRRGGRGKRRGGKAEGIKGKEEEKEMKGQKI
jgi:hypothetical protein